jgi:hypothetical protein
MNNAIKKAGVVVLSVICFFAAKAVVKSIMEGSRTTSFASSAYEETYKKEVSESGVDAAAGKEILDSVKAMVRDKKKIVTLEEAYGDAVGKTTKEIRVYLNSHPTRKALVGDTTAKVIKESLKLPVQLDEYTSVTGLNYSESAESVVYHYTLADEILKLFDGDYEALKTALAELNPDSVCKLSLQLLGQGFDMTYSYRDSSGKELFSIVRTYEDCERMGFTKYS